MNRFRQLSFGWALCLVVLLVIPLIVLADDISNNLDASVDAIAEVMPLTLGGPNGATQLYVVPRNGDGKSGCNLTGSTTLVVSVSSSNTSVASVNPSSVTFTSCGDTPTLTVTPVGLGSATISVSQISNDTEATFNLAPATFTVNVSSPPNTPPSIAVTGVTGGASYEIGSVPAANCSVVDAEDGPSTFPATLSAISGPLAVYGLGEQTASCSYTDAGGLTVSAAETYGIVDTTAPVITFVSRTSANANGWNKGDVTVVWSCSDSGSGVVEASVTQTYSSEGANQSATGTCEDHAGNTSSDTQSGINIDKTAPTISGSAAPAPNGNGWNNTDVVVSFTCGDSLSGIATCGPDQTLSSEGTNQSATGTAVDKADNSASTTVGDINIDKTAPSVTVTGVTNGASYTLGSVPAADCDTSDALAGVATSASLSTSGGPVGSVTATCSSAVDNAGNSSSPVSVTYNIVYNWAGFFQPVENPGPGPNYVFNRAKAGSAIPLKFSLSGDQGLGIIMSGYPKSENVSCSSASAMDDLTETINAGGSSLNYDSSVDQYNYVWKTDKAWAGKCRKLTMKLIDGTEHVAYFNFTK